MKILINLFFVFIFSNFLFAEKFEIVDIEKIKNEISSESSPFFYPELYSRYSSHDQLLKVEDYRYLYYGNAVQPYFAPNLSKRDELSNSFKEFINSEKIDYNKAIEMANFILRFDPFYLPAIYLLSTSYYKAGDTLNSKIWYDKYSKIIQAILQSGNGQTPQTAYKVLSVDDEHTILLALKLESSEREFIEISGKPFHLLRIKSNPKSIENIYFDIDLFYIKSLQNK